jgi:hypothetical protein
MRTARWLAELYKFRDDKFAEEELYAELRD